MDLKNETDNNNYAYNNQVNRTEAIYTIEKDLLKYSLLGVEDVRVGDSITINFYYRKGSETKTAVLYTTSTTTQDALGDDITKHYLRYTDVEGQKYSWEMKGAEIDPCGFFTYYIDNSSNSYYFKLNMYLYNTVYHDRNNKDRNNAVDDIEITYSGEKGDLITTNGNYLTGNTKIEKEIGICTN